MQSCGYCAAARMVVAFGVLLVQSRVHGEVISFEDLSLAPNSFFAGPMPGAVSGPGPFGSTQLTGSFSSGSVEFVNRYLVDFDSWDGFAYSNMGDTTTAGFGNQYSAFAGGDRTTGSGTFGVATGYLENLVAPTLAMLQELPYFTVPTGMVVTGAYLTNTTYAALAMRDGDMFAKAFGGPSGDDPDSFVVRAYGVDALGNIFTATPEFYLADYRSADNTQDFILDEWGFFDLSSLAGAASIHFNLETTDVGAFGSNTPMYFAIDDIQLVPEAVPEPSSAVLALVAAGGLWRFRRRNRSTSSAADREAKEIAC